MVKSLIVGCCILLGLCCSFEKNELILVPVKLQANIKADTVWAEETTNSMVLKIKVYGHLGEFTNSYVLIKRNLGGSKVYTLNPPDDLDVKVADDHINLVEQNDQSLGWFFLRNYKVLPKLPKVDSLVKNLEAQNKSLFVREDNGVFSLYKKGVLVDKIQYGNYNLGNKMNFDSLGFGLYKVSNNKLTKISEDGRDLLKQKDGLYYVPYPGYKIKYRYSLIKVLAKIDSLSPTAQEDLTIKIR